MTNAKSKGRREDPRLLRGQGRYTADWNMPGQLHAAFLRSDRAHAVIRSIDKSAAERSPGVRLVLTGADIQDAGFKTLPSLVFFPGRNGFKLLLPERSPLAKDRVRFVGEPVALVIADTAAMAADAAEKIRVEYEDLPAVIGVERALGIDVGSGPSALDPTYEDPTHESARLESANIASASTVGRIKPRSGGSDTHSGTGFDQIVASIGKTRPPLVHANIPGNVCFDFEYGDEQKAAQAIATAPHVVRLAMDSPRVAPSPMETRAVLAWFDQGKYQIRCPHQGAFAMRDALAGMLGVESSKVRVNTVDVGGAFGARVSPYYEFAVLAHAAKRLGKPVKWVSTRSEDFLNDGHGRAIKLQGELALGAHGEFLALRTLWLADSGAYLCQAGALTNCGNNKTIGAGAYQVGALYSRHLQLITNTTPTEAYRGAGRPEAAYVVERLVDEAAAKLGIDRLELRRRNAIPRAAMPYTTLSGTQFDSADFAALLAAAAAEARWKEFPARREEAKRRGKLRGLGLALFIEPSGAGVPKDEVAVEFAKGKENEGEVHLFMASGSSGQGHETVFPELVGGWLGIDPEKIVLRAGDPDGPQVAGGPAIGSRTAFAQGSVFKKAADEIIRKGLDLASKTLEASSADIEFRDGRYVVKGTDRGILITDLVERHRKDGAHPLDTLAESPTTRAFPSGAHACEVEIDPDTGEAEIVTFTAVDDLGRAIDLAQAEGQVMGGAVQSAGHVFGERCLYDEVSGQMLSGSFMDYPMPRADLVREFRMRDCSIPSPNNALGAKGAGEAGTTGGLPACMSAVMDALRSAGVTEFDLPATPDRLWRALK